MGEEIDCILCHQSDEVIKFTNLIGQTQIRMFVHGLSIKLILVIQHNVKYYYRHSPMSILCECGKASHDFYRNTPQHSGKCCQVHLSDDTGTS